MKTYTNEELVEKCAKYFGVNCDTNDPEHVRVARTRVHEVEFDSTGVKRSRQQVRQLSRKFKELIKNKIQKV